MPQLNNNHNVYILGAGFSVDRGLPSIQNFMLSMRDAHEWLKKNHRDHEAEAIEAVLDFRLSAASAAYRVKLDLENIEELFSLASASSRALANKIRLAIAATLDYKLHTSEEPKIRFQSNENLNLPFSWGKTNSHDVRPLSPYDIECPAYEFYLKSLIGNWDEINNFHTNSIITFNYDLLVEQALSNLSIPFDYGIKSSVPENHVELLKLHGSINWAAKNSTSNYVISNSYEELRQSNQIPQLVPPTWRKIFTGPLRQIWDKSLNSLEKATRIFVIGFSIPSTDNHFKYLMAAGLQNNISLREIIFINPDKSGIESRARSLFGDATVVGQVSNTNPIVKIIGCNFSNFLSSDKHSLSSYGRSMPRAIQNISLYKP